MVITLTSPIVVDAYITLSPQSYRVFMNDCGYLHIMGVEYPMHSYKVAPEKAWSVYFKLVEAKKQARH